MADRLRYAGRLAPVGVLLLLVLLLVLAILAPGVSGLRLAGPEARRAAAFGATLADLPTRGALVVVGFDPDLGTYSEIRPTVRVVLSALLERGARLALVSFTPDGRALAVAERARLRDGGVAADRLVDLGFLPGAEAALVRATRSAPGGLADGGQAAGASLADADLVVVIGGNDLGPRSWVEQVGPRLPATPIMAVTPTYAAPELEPYLATGQLRALLATSRDAAAYREGSGLEGRSVLVEPSPLSPAAVLIGMLVALAVIGRAMIGRMAVGLRRGGLGGGR